MKKHIIHVLSDFKKNIETAWQLGHLCGGTPTCVAISQSPAATEASASWRHKETLWNSPAASWCDAERCRCVCVWIMFNQRERGWKWLNSPKTMVYTCVVLYTQRNPEVESGSGHFKRRRVELWSHDGASVLHPTRATQDAQVCAFQQYFVQLQTAHFGRFHDVVFVSWGRPLHFLSPIIQV